MSKPFFPKSQPILRSRRLRLTELLAADSLRVALLAGDPAIARSSVSIPQPYSPGQALAWIEGLPALWAEARGGAFAIRLESGISAPGELIGCASFTRLDEFSFSCGYWIGQSHWGRGYATEALNCALGFAFRSCRARKICARHFPDNIASADVLKKTGFHPISPNRAHPSFPPLAPGAPCSHWELPWELWIIRQPVLR